MTIRERALGAFYGLALGDALGMPTQSLSREQIRKRFGVLSSLRDADPDHPIAPRMPAGSITDDTEQAMLVAALLVQGQGRIAPMELARALSAWEQTMKEKGSLDLLGPSTRRALDLILAGSSLEEAGRFGTTNGAAMRIAPIGIAFDLRRADAFFDAVVQACQVTHNTTLGIAGAAAVAAAVSAGLNGASPAQALDAGCEAARRGERYGHWVAGGAVAPRIRWVRSLAETMPTEELPDFLYEVVGTSVASQESVVSAFALAQKTAMGALSPFEALCQAASLGGDTDTMAAVLGAMLGACCGLAAWPEPELATIKQVNALDLAPLTEALLMLRSP